MHDHNINHAFLDPVVSGAAIDTYYHLGVRSDDPVLEAFRDVRAVVLAGTRERVVDLAAQWSDRRDGAEVIALPQEDRFVTRYCDTVLFASHGMGIPSASIALHELMRLLYYLTAGDLARLDDVFWARVGTCGGVGLEPGTVVVSTEAVMADLTPLHLHAGTAGEVGFVGRFSSDVARSIASLGAPAGIPVALGRTVTTDDFFLGQLRLDGALRLGTPAGRAAWLRGLAAADVRGIEMEGAVVAGLLNSWGFSRIAMACAVVVNRLDGDQIDLSAEQLSDFGRRAGDLVLTHLARSNR